MNEYVSSEYEGFGAKFLSPDDCPWCHKSISIEFLYVNVLEDLGLNPSPDKLEAVFACPNISCRRLIIGLYANKGYMGSSSFRLFELQEVNAGNFYQQYYGSEIEELSPDFVSIHNEASAAEQAQLLKICGAGYRRALEFLLKDFVIKIKEKPEDEIKTKFLGKLISEDIEDTDIKEIARRATWLGNDHVHVHQKWENKDLDDLKDLIELTTYYISAEVKKGKILASMGQGR